MREIKNAPRAMLNALTANYGTRHVRKDPVLFARRYAAPLDRETAAFVAALLSYGRVEQILRSVQNALEKIGPHPYEALCKGGYAVWEKKFRDFRHRFTSGKNLSYVLAMAGALMKETGTLELSFMEGYRPHRSVREGLSRLVKRILSYKRPGPLPRGVKFLLPSPDGGSACKRLLMFLRWMVRPADGVDMGLWKGVRPADLIVPLDVHVGRLSRRMGLTARRASDWKTAEDVTRALKRFSPSDPLRYDFALAHFGMEETRKRSEKKETLP